MARFGISPRDPLDYLGIQLAAVPTVAGGRDPTTTDTKYPIQTIWQNTVSRDEFILTHFTAGAAQWQKFLDFSGDFSISTLIVSTSTALSGTFTYDGISSGYAGSLNNWAQAGVQTTDGTATAIATIALTTNEMVSVEARINGFRSDSTEGVVCRLFYGARRAAAGAIELGIPIIETIEDSSGSATVDADVSTNDVRLLVQGEAAKTFNWVATYQFHRTRTSA